LPPGKEGGYFVGGGGWAGQDHDASVLDYKASVTHRRGRKSWVVQALRYDRRERALSGEGQPTVRVRHAAGGAALGLALRAALELPRPRRKAEVVE
jgi:hypothetical protein